MHGTAASPRSAATAHESIKQEEFAVLKTKLISVNPLGAFANLLAWTWRTVCHHTYDANTFFHISSGSHWVNNLNHVKREWAIAKPEIPNFSTYFFLILAMIFEYVQCQLEVGSGVEATHFESKLAANSPLFRLFAVIFTR